MEILHDIHQNNGHKIEIIIGSIDFFDGESCQILERSKKIARITHFSSTIFGQQTVQKNTTTTRSSIIIT